MDSTKAVLYIRREGTGEEDSVIADGGATALFLKSDQPDALGFKIPDDAPKTNALFVYSTQSGVSATFAFDDAKAFFLDLGVTPDGTTWGADSSDTEEAEITIEELLASMLEADLAQESRVMTTFREEATKLLALVKSDKSPCVQLGVSRRVLNSVSGFYLPIGHRGINHLMTS